MQDYVCQFFVLLAYIPDSIPIYNPKSQQRSFNCDFRNVNKDNPANCIKKSGFT